TRVTRQRFPVPQSVVDGYADRTLRQYVRLTLLLLEPGVELRQDRHCLLLPPSEGERFGILGRQGRTAFLGQALALIPNLVLDAVQLAIPGQGGMGTCRGARAGVEELAARVGVAGDF